MIWLLSLVVIAGAPEGAFASRCDDYSKLMDYSLLFYEAQRSGKLPSSQRVKWRKDSALSDGGNIDLAGGYYDGKYLLGPIS